RSHSGRALPSRTPLPGWRRRRGPSPPAARRCRPGCRAGPGCRRGGRQVRSMAYPLRMRGKDPETDEYLAPSRSQDRRDALEVLALGERLVALTDAQLARLAVPEDLLPHIRDTRRISSHIARKRQLAFLAKQMRREDEETLDAIRDALDEKGESARQETAA